jgi:hypothetical protein
MRQWRTVRVFISSTFRDRHAERDHLVTVAFSELRERVERLGLPFLGGGPRETLNNEHRQAGSAPTRFLR